MSEPRRHLVRGKRELEAIASPVRQEIVDVLARMGGTTIAALAAALGRPADGLYYHVRALQRAGLVRAVEGAVAGGRAELRIRAAAPEFVLRYDASPGGNAREVRAIVASMLRLGARDFRRSLVPEGVTLEGPARELWALRMTGWLTPADLVRVNARIRQLARSVASLAPVQAPLTAARRARLYGITVLLTPLDHRGRTPRRRRSGTRGAKS